MSSKTQQRLKTKNNLDIKIGCFALLCFLIHLLSGLFGLLLSGITAAHPQPIRGPSAAHPRPIRGPSAAHPRPIRSPSAQGFRALFLHRNRQKPVQKTRPAILYSCYQVYVLYVLMISAFGFGFVSFGFKMVSFAFCLLALCAF